MPPRLWVVAPNNACMVCEGQGIRIIQAPSKTRLPSSLCQDPRVEEHDESSELRTHDCFATHRPSPLSNVDVATARGDGNIGAFVRPRDDGVFEKPRGGAFYAKHGTGPRTTAAASGNPQTRRAHVRSQPAAALAVAGGRGGSPSGGTNLAGARRRLPRRTSTQTLRPLPRGGPDGDRCVRGRAIAVASGAAGGRVDRRVKAPHVPRIRRRRNWEDGRLPSRSAPRKSFGSGACRGERKARTTRLTRCCCVASRLDHRRLDLGSRPGEPPQTNPNRVTTLFPPNSQRACPCLSL
jgi:hypothetical protein